MWTTTSSRDNWERLVAAVIKREQIRQLCHQDSITTVDSDFSDRTLSLRSVSLAPSPQLSLARNSTVEVRKGGYGTITQKLFSALLWWNKPKDFDLDISVAVMGSLSANGSSGGGSPVDYKLENSGFSNLRAFTFSEVRAATRNFRGDAVLGEGGFGKVYKGWLDSRNRDHGSVIAVKKLNSESLQGLQEWQSEVNFLGRLSHPNLIKLLGYCREDKELLLVYEFMQKGSLANHLFGRGASIQPIPWDTRLKLAIGAARGLAFLHASEVIFRDFKTSHILLDGSYHVKLTDFGLAKMGPTDSESHVSSLSTRVLGTYGFAAPEYLATGHLTSKSDVYSFGVVLLEMLTGRRSMDKNRPNGEHNLVEWARPYLGDRKHSCRVIDPRLEGHFSIKGAQKAAQLAARCLSWDLKARPLMSEVVNALKPLPSLKDMASASYYFQTIQADRARARARARMGKQA